MSNKSRLSKIKSRGGGTAGKQKKIKKNLLYGLLVLVVLVVVGTVIFFLARSTPKRDNLFGDPNGLFEMELPEDWIYYKGADVVKFDSSLGHANYSFVFYPKGQNMDDQMKNFTGNVLTCAVFLKEWVGDKNHYDKFFGYIGGVKDPKKYMTEEIFQKGEKIPGAKEEGSYTFEKGWPLATVKSKGAIIFFNGSYSGDEEKKAIEKMILSIKTP
ncbi:MAG: hypothetical protein GX421_03810 [Caldisericales bacterium]|nr:hypothetical protein [Caldisericales bacterium]